MQNPQNGVVGGRPRILLVEDSAVSRRVAAIVLQRLGLEVHAAASAREAIEVFGSACFELVLMDCHMPEMDGLECTRSLRRLENGGRRTPIIAFTCLNNPEECKQAGMDAHVLKTGDFVSLQRELRNWISLPLP